MLDGSKMWCSYAHKASHVLIVCRTTQEDDKHAGLSMIFVPTDAEGFSMRPIPTLGGEETNELHLDGVRVPEEALLGTEGNGWIQLMAGLNNERVILGAQALGLAQRSFDDALAYVKERKQFGRPVGTFQAQQHRFADLATQLTQTRLLVRWVARLTDEDPDRMLPQEASMVKLSATELAKRCALECGARVVAAAGCELHAGLGPRSALEQPVDRGAEHDRVADRRREARAPALPHPARHRGAEVGELPGEVGGGALHEPGGAQVAGEAAQPERRRKPRVVRRHDEMRVLVER